jgi:uncharacterized protein (DUF2252 family)
VSAGAKQISAVEPLTLAERAARGRGARSELPRSVHANWEAPPGRPDPVELLEAQGQARVAELLPVRYGRMLVSPFAFYRGAAALMALDLAHGPRSDMIVQLCGDAHLLNFGVYAAPDRRLVFSVNDFDETLPGPFEWDVKRLVASVAVAGRDLGLDRKQRWEIAMAVGRSYREAIRRFAAMRTIDLWYAREEVDEIGKLLAARGTAKQMRQFEGAVSKARTRDSLRAFAKLTRTIDGEPRIIADPPLIVPIEDLTPPAELPQLDGLVRGIIRSYRHTLAADRRRLLERFRYAHAAHKVVGVGSVGTRAWIVLMLGHDHNEPLFLQVKEAQRSVLEPFLGESQFPNHGQRVVEGQKLMQAASDIFLGWIRTEDLDGVDRDYYVRQLWDQKGSAALEQMLPALLSDYAELCGWTLARAHARSGDAIAISNYLGTGSSFDRALAAFAERYADQNERDYDALKAAAKSGRVKTETGL